MELGFYNFLNVGVMCVTSIVVPVIAVLFNPRGTGTACKRNVRLSDARPFLGLHVIIDLLARQN